MGASDSRLASFYYGYGHGHTGASEADAGGAEDDATSAGRSSSPTSTTERGANVAARHSRGDRGNVAWSPPRRLSTLNSLGRLLGLGTGGYFSRRELDARRSHESYLSQPSSLHERILAFQYEGVFLDESDDDGTQASAWADDEGYTDSLQNAADFLVGKGRRLEKEPKTRGERAGNRYRASFLHPAFSSST